MVCMVFRSIDENDEGMAFLNPHDIREIGPRSTLEKGVTADGMRRIVHWQCSPSQGDMGARHQNLLWVSGYHPDSNLHADLDNYGEVFI